mgnify:CR=1 FL=1
MNTKYIIKNYLYFLIYIFILYHSVVGKIFPIPKSLKTIVEFWKKIYTEVSLSEGLLHDREYPLIIYKKVSNVPMFGKHRTRIITREKEKIKILLKNISIKPASSRTDQEKYIVKLFQKYAPKSAIVTAKNRLRFQQGQRERFIEGLYRSGAYIDSIKTIMSQYNIPVRLAYLPHVESYSTKQ